MLAHFPLRPRCIIKDTLLSSFLLISPSSPNTPPMHPCLRLPPPGTIDFQEWELQGPLGQKKRVKKAGGRSISNYGKWANASLAPVSGGGEGRVQLLLRESRNEVSGPSLFSAARVLPTHPTPPPRGVYGTLPQLPGRPPPRPAPQLARREAERRFADCCRRAEPRGGCWGGPLWCEASMKALGNHGPFHIYGPLRPMQGFGKVSAGH